MKKALFLSTLLLASGWTPILAQPPQVEFVGTITGISMTDDENGTLTIAVTETVELAVAVNELTEIRKEGEPAALADLEEGDFARVAALFSDDGFVALEVDVVEAAAAFILKGRIEDLNVGTREITISGLAVPVAEDAAIIINREEAAFEDLEIGQRARLSGRVDEGEITALRVRAFGPRDALARVRFEGTVTAIADDSIHVQIFGLATPTPVLMDDDTEVKGDLEIGALVRVSGVLTPELFVKAHRIQVLSLVQLVPSRLRVREGKSRTVRILVRVPQETALEFGLGSEDPDTAVPTSDVAVLEAGERTTSFEVLGVARGETTIVVSVPGDLGGGTLKLPVEVVDADHDGNDDDRPRLGFWMPRELKMAPGQQRRARLWLRRPADGDVVVSLTLHKGPAGLVAFPAKVKIPAGRRSVPVVFTAGSNEGEVEIRATFPGGQTADIEIEVESDHDGAGGS